MSEHDLWQGVLYLERMRAIARRFGYGSLVALGILIVTGWAMASHYAAILVTSLTIVWLGLDLIS